MIIFAKWKTCSRTFGGPIWTLPWWHPLDFHISRESCEIIISFHKGIRKFWYIWKLVMHTNISSKSMKCKFYSNESTGRGCEGTARRPTHSGPGCSFPPCWLRRAHNWVSLTGCPGSLRRGCSHPVSGWCKVQGLPPTSVGDVMVSFMCCLTGPYICMYLENTDYCKGHPTLVLWVK